MILCPSAWVGLRSPGDVGVLGQPWRMRSLTRVWCSLPMLVAGDSSEPRQRSWSHSSPHCEGLPAPSPARILPCHPGAMGLSWGEVLSQGILSSPQTPAPTLSCNLALPDSIVLAMAAGEPQPDPGLLPQGRSPGTWAWDWEPNGICRAAGTRGKAGAARQNDICLHHTGFRAH